MSRLGVDVPEPRELGAAGLKLAAVIDHVRSECLDSTEKRSDPLLEILLDVLSVFDCRSLVERKLVVTHGLGGGFLQIRCPLSQLVSSVAWADGSAPGRCDPGLSDAIRCR